MISHQLLGCPLFSDKAINVLVLDREVLTSFLLQGWVSTFGHDILYEILSHGSFTWIILKMDDFPGKASTHDACCMSILTFD